MAKPAAPYSLRQGEAIGPGALRLLDEMSQSARNIAERPPAQLSESVHDLRVLIKRLRALLWFLRPALSASRYNRSKVVLRKAAGQLSQTRDLDAMRIALAKASEDAHPEHRQALEQVAQALARKRAPRKKLEASPRQLTQRAAEIILHVIAKTRRALERTTEWPSAGKRLSKALKQTEKAAGRALKKKQPPLVHEWRKKTKRLLYELQFTLQHVKKRMAGSVKKIDQLQEKLGDFQDSIVAEDHLGRKPLRKTTPEHVEATIRLLKKRRKQLLKKARLIWRSAQRDL